MTDKRYWYDFEDCDRPKIVDFEKNKEYYLETIGDFCEIENLLNELYDENVRLKKLVDEGEDIIICQCTPYYQRIWENIKKNIKDDVE